MYLWVQNSKTNVLHVACQTFIRFWKRNAAEEEHA
jgi:hypothetical protein